SQHSSDTATFFTSISDLLCRCLENCLQKVLRNMLGYTNLLKIFPTNISLSSCFLMPDSPVWKSKVIQAVQPLCIWLSNKQHFASILNKGDMHENSENVWVFKKRFAYH